ncbi:solute carrier family 28 member 3-like [Lineus longissimus]|uniref:solute carrier family 28 member 3-like n=1 Tax=Lineus longissimus TaxID=88925 RepID=UPI002B4C96F0
MADVWLPGSSIADEGAPLLPAVLARLNEVEDELRAVRKQLETRDGTIGFKVEHVTQNHVTPEINARSEFEIDDAASKPEVAQGRFNKLISKVTGGCKEFWFHHSRHVALATKVAVLLLYGAYFCYAMYYSFGDEASIRLLGVTTLAFVLTLYVLFRDRVGLKLYKSHISPFWKKVKRKRRLMIVLKCTFGLICLSLLLAALVLEIAMKDSKNLASLGGMCFLLLITFITSKHPGKVKWRPVVCGMVLQFVFALMILRTTWGHGMFNWLGERVKEFLAHADKGAGFVFGPEEAAHMIAFQLLPVLVFFSSIISVLYYLGWMQVVIRKIAWILQKVLATTAAESVNASSNIFLGFAESPLVILPLLKFVTVSELHAIMVGGFATIGGGILATYILFGIPAAHLLTACIISAPAALAVAKLSYPEIEATKLSSKDVGDMGKSTDANLVEAISSGAVTSIKLCAYVIVNLIAFVSFLDLVDGTLNWIGQRVGIGPPNNLPLSFQLILSYLLWPVAFVMGIDTADCRQAAELLGMKAFLTEFIAYLQLGEMIRNREFLEDLNFNGTIIEKTDGLYLPALNKTLKYGVMSERSEVITTYALCGFCSVQGIGIMIGVMGSIMPDRKAEISATVVRAFMCGTVACYLTACVAGLLYEPSP